MDILTHYHPRTRQEPDEPLAEDDKWEVFARSMAEVNPISSAILYGAPVFSVEKDYNPFEHVVDKERIKKYDPNLFIKSYSQEMTDDIISKADERTISLEIMDRNPGTTLVGGILGTVADPLLWGSPAKGVAKFAGLEMLREAGSEVLMHGTQPTRTFEQSALEVGFTGAGAAVLGGIGKLLTRGKVDEVDEIIKNATPEQKEVIDKSAGAMEAEKATFEELDPTFGIGNKFLHLSATGHSYLTTKSARMREFLGNIVPLSFQTKQMAKGKAHQTAWALARKTDDDIVMIETSFNKNYEKYRKSAPEGGAGLTEQQFADEVGRAMSNNDIHPIPEVSATAKAFRPLDDELYDISAKYGQYGEERQIMAMDGIKPEVKGALSHLQRIFRRDSLENTKIISELRKSLKVKLAEQIPSGKRILVKQGKRIFAVDERELAQVLSTTEGAKVLDVSKKTPQTLDAEYDTVVDSIIKNMAGGENLDEISGDFIVPKPGTLHERTLTLLDDTELDNLGLLHKDAREVMSITSNQMRKEHALQEIFGERDLKGIKTEIAQEYDGLLRKAENAGDDKLYKKLLKQKEKDLKYVSVLRDIFMGTYQTVDPTSNFKVLNDGVRQYNTITLLVAPVITNLPDLVSPAMRNGLLPLAKTYSNMMRGGWAKNRELVQALGIIAEATTGNRVGSIMEAGGQLSKFQANNYRMWAKWSGMNAITDLAKGAATLTTSNKWYKQFKNFDSLKPKEVSRLAESGLDRDAVQTINAQLSKHGKKERGFINPHIEKWMKDGKPDDKAIELYKSAMKTEVNRQVIEPLPGDMPRGFYSGEFAGTGKNLGQFMSFVYAATTRFGVMGLQRHDAEFLMTVIAMSAVGVASETLKGEIRGRKPSDPVELLLAGWDRGGSMGFIGTIPSAAYSLSKRDFRGRMMTKEPWQVMTGPMYAPMARIPSIMYNLSTGEEPTNKEMLQALRSLPIFNMYHAIDLGLLISKGRGHADK